MKQFLAAVLVAVLVLPSSGLAASSWIRFEDSQLFSNFLYHKSSGEWVSDDGEHYDSTTDLLDHYGFSYSDRFDVWYNEDGILDSDMCLQPHWEDNYFYCDYCETFMGYWENEDPDCHADFCIYSEVPEGGYDNEPEYSTLQKVFYVVCGVILLAVVAIVIFGQVGGAICCFCLAIKSIREKIRSRKNK